MTVDKERGFTLIELVFAILIIVLLLVSALFLLRTDNYNILRQDAQRRTDVSHIVQGINRYVADTGQLPPNIPSKLSAISSGSGQYNLCSYLVPKYMSDLPLDPSYGVKLTKDNIVSDAVCNTANLTYATGYGIQRVSDGRILVMSTLTNNGKIIMYVPNSAGLQ